MRNCRVRTNGRMFDPVRAFAMRNPVPGRYVMKVGKLSMSVGVVARAR